MGFFSRLFVNAYSPEELVEFLAPLAYTGTKLSREAEQRFIKLPVEVQSRALLKGLSKRNENIRYVCAERLSFFTGTSIEITEALLRALQDSSQEVRLHAANYFRISPLATVSLYGKLPFPPSLALEPLRTAQRSETDDLVRQALSSAIETLEKLNT